jgi:hypothetical protein
MAMIDSLGPWDWGDYQNYRHTILLHTPSLARYLSRSIALECMIYSSSSPSFSGVVKDTHEKFFRMGASDREKYFKPS